ncbi:MAG TPA: acetylxylan esterase [Bryobacteraceae bacterium]|jgi:dienelactone hydrolase
MLTSILLAATLVAADPATALTEWFANIAAHQLDKREAEIKAIQTRAQAEARKIHTREALLQSLNGLPDYKGPLNARMRGTLDAGAYTIEKMSYESLPRYVVSANLYVPKSGGKHPAVLFPLGHWQPGKPYAQRIAGNLARKGFVVLAYDPVGQGEREQAFDSRYGRSLIGGSTDEHMMDGALSLLIGDGVMRYFVFDGMRGIDYLTSRSDVDAERIGVTGCSGGGTVTTFLSALDPRVKVAAPACYMQTFRALINGPTGDSEQSNPNFIALGLDQTDLVELFAPKPWLISSTEHDFFTPAGAKPVYEEARRWYSLYDASDRIKWVVGPGGHGTPEIVRETIYAWMLKWLGGDPHATAKDEDVPMFAEHELWVTENGQLGAETRELYEVIAERRKARQTPADLSSYLKTWLAHTPEPEPELQMEIVPAQGTPSGRGVLLVERQWELDADAKELAAKGDVVLILHPRGFPLSNPKSVNIGDPVPNIRAALVGLNLPLLRTHDVLRGVDKLAGIAGVKEVRAEARDVAGYWVLAAAAVDHRIQSVRLTETPWSINAAFSAPLTRALYQVAMPDFSLHWDTRDLIDLIQPRKVEWIDPTDWNQNIIPVKGDVFEYTKYQH